MKTHLAGIAAVMLLVVHGSQGATYYVATDGSDTNSGTALASPFRSLQKACGVMVAGDTCLIRAGTYCETLAPSNSGNAGSPMTFMPYNSETVTISAADAVAGWTAYSGSVYKAVMTWDLGAGFNQVFVNGAMVNEARWPNTGTNLLSPTLASGNAASGTVTFSVSRSSNYWSGGTVYGCFGYKWLSQGASIVASSTDGILTVTNETSTWFTGSGNGYVTGIFSELDSAGEWFLLGTNLYLWAPGSVNPATLTVTAKRRKWCVNLSGRSHVAVRNLTCFAGSISVNANACEVSGCTVSYLSHFTKYTWGGMDAGGDIANGNNGVLLNGTANVISNCTFTYSAGSGIVIDGASNLVTRCVVREIDYSGTYSCPLAIKSSKGGNRIQFNTLYNTGRDVLQLYGANADEILYNNLYNAGKLCADLGITYQWGRDGKDTRIAYNWIHGNLTGGPGIYNDNYSRGFIEDHNVIWSCGSDAGIRLNEPCDSMMIYNNTLFNCGDVGTSTYNCYPISLPGWWTYGNVANSTGINNLFLGTSPATHLTDYANNDFTLKAGAAAIDSGSVVSPYTDGYTGSAPDKGAYETGRSQWSAGHNGVALVPLTSPHITTEPATNVLINSAVLNGSLTATGAAPTAVWVFWGDDDALTVPTNWDHSIAFGTNSDPVPVAYSTNITELTPETTYYYRYYATNAFDVSWGQAVSFTPSITQTVTFSINSDLDIKPDQTKSTAATVLIAGDEEGGAGQDRRVFIKFDMSGLQPDWTIRSATLRLYHIAGTGDDYGNAYLYGVTNVWNESSITYAHPVSSSLGYVVGNSGPFNEFKEVNVTAFMQAYQSDTNQHHSFSIRGTEGYTLTAKYFVSSEGSVGQRPELVVVYSAADSDRDGIPDAWECQYFTNLTTATTNSDWDKDGMTDVAEYLAGTGPTDPSSKLAFSSALASAGAGPVIGWFSVTNKCYVVRRSTNLLDTWTDISGIITATPPINVYTDSTPADCVGFYRIKLQ